MEAGIPWTQIAVETVDLEFERLTKIVVDFSVRPFTSGTSKYAEFNDSYGNNIAIVEELKESPSQ